MIPDSLLGHYAREARKRHRRERFAHCVMEGIYCLATLTIVGLLTAFFIIQALG